MADNQDWRTLDSEFIALLTANQQRILSFVLTLLPNWNEAEEVAQRTYVILWEKRRRFDMSRQFVPWALGFARMEVRKYLGSTYRNRVVLSGAAIDSLQAEMASAPEPDDQRRAALSSCLAELPRERRALVEQCYSGEAAIKEIAQSLAMTADALYLRLRRVRIKLLECINRKMTARSST
jgi:RNA polymerase sigma-70 factor (ECF subfamily)